MSKIEALLKEDLPMPLLSGYIACKRALFYSALSSANVSNPVYTVMLLAIYTSSNNFLSTSKTAFAVFTTIATAAISEWGLLYVLFFYTRHLLHKLHYFSYAVLIVSEAAALKGFMTLPFVFHSFKKVSGR